MNSNSSVLITGATGFIGARLVELLVRKTSRIRIATSDLSHCARIARFPIELVKADLLSPKEMARAVEGCDVLFHLAYKFGGDINQQRQVNLDGTRALAEAFLQNGGQRFVHVSSISAYGVPRNGDLAEGASPIATSDSYSNVKLEIEKLLINLHRTSRLPITIIQPTIVYGPYGSTWTTRLLEQVRRGQVVLPLNGRGLCNAVYVDDVISALMLAAENEAAVGETFLISGAAPVTWGEFYGAYEKMMKKPAVIEMPDTSIRAEKARRKKNQSLFQRTLGALAKRPALRRELMSIPPQSWLLRGGQNMLPLLPASAQTVLKRKYEALWKLPSSDGTDSPDLYLPDDETRRLYSAMTRVRIDKARDMLGYKPAFDLEGGMALTENWARWARLIPDPAGAIERFGVVGPDRARLTS
jgi:nucleoside-diphosphate-sugar epimerase